MLTIYYDKCFLCNSKDGLSELFIESSTFSIHQSCWKIHAGQDDLIKFSTFDQWKEFAGSRWDLLDRCVVFDNGTKHWVSNNKLHRENSPAVENAGGTKQWYLNNERHREAGPAIEYANGDKSWYFNGKLHRESEAAIECVSGTKKWFQHGLLHREAGPAVEYFDGTKWWYLSGKELSEEEFNIRMKTDG